MIAKAITAAMSTVALVALGETNRITQLPPVVVYASRIYDSTEQMAAPVQIYDRTAIADTGARSLPDLLEKTANLQIRTLNANPLQAQIALRGFGENSTGRVKLIIDGEELNDTDMEAPNLARIPIDGIERLEILPGPNPVLYGDGAVAGVINLITDNRDYTRKTKITARGGSYGNIGVNLRTRGGIATNGLTYSATYDYQRSDGYRRRSGSDLHTALGGLRQHFENGSHWGLKANYFNARYQMPGALTYDQWKADPRQARYENDWCRIWNYGLSFDSKARVAEDQWLYTDAAFALKHRKSNWGDYGYANEYDLYTYQFAPRYVNEKNLFEHENEFTAGFDFKYDRYEVADRSGFNNPRYHFDRARYALFAQDEFSLTDTLAFLAGARSELIDNRWTNYRGLNETHSNRLMGDYELGLVYRPLAGLKTYLKGSRFHRSPYCDEMNYTEDGNFLKPETGSALDLGLDWQIEKEFHFDLAGYWTLIDDEIFYNPHAKDYGGYYGGYNCNSPGRTERLGFDTGLSWKRVKTAAAAIRYGFVKSRFVNGEYAGDTIPLVPQSRVRAEVAFWLFDDLKIQGGYRYVAAQTLGGDFENDHQRLAGYSLFDLSAHYSPAWADAWKIAFMIDNLLDRQYCDYAGWSDYSGAYYYPACGRSFFVSLSYEF